MTDDGTAPHPLTLYNGPQLKPIGRMSGSAVLDGTDDHARTTASVVDTSKSFSVAAWVRSTDSGEGAVVAAEGSRASAFRLYRMSTTGRWAFSRDSTDSDSPAVVRVESEETTLWGAWTHVAGVFDASAKTLQLFVNGLPQGSPTSYSTTPWKAAGPLSIGRYKFGGVFGGFLDGSVDQVQVWNRAISAGEAKALANPRSGGVPGGTGSTVAGLSAHWPLDNTYTADGQPWRSSDVAYGASLELAGFGADPIAAFEHDDTRGDYVLHVQGRESLSLDRPVVDVETSFTVAAWVRLEDPTRSSVIVRQAGTNRDPWRLEYKPDASSTGRWIFSRAKTDSTSEVPTEATATVDKQDAADYWTLLVGMYDAGSGQISLRLFDEQKKQLTFSSSVRTGKETVLGQDSSTGLYGWIDDVRLYAGIKPDHEICAELMDGESCGQ